jgi:hypothetical protein
VIIQYLQNIVKSPSSEGVKRANKPENGIILPVREQRITLDSSWGLMGSTSRKASVAIKFFEYIIQFN